MGGEECSDEMPPPTHCFHALTHSLVPELLYLPLASSAKSIFTDDRSISSVSMIDAVTASTKMNQSSVAIISISTRNGEIKSPTSTTARAGYGSLR